MGYGSPSATRTRGARTPVGRGSYAIRRNSASMLAVAPTELAQSGSKEAEAPGAQPAPAAPAAPASVATAAVAAAQSLSPLPPPFQFHSRARHAASKANVDVWRTSRPRKGLATPSVPKVQRSSVKRGWALLLLLLLLLLPLLRVVAPVAPPLPPMLPAAPPAQRPSSASTAARSSCGGRATIASTAWDGRGRSRRAGPTVNAAAAVIGAVVVVAVLLVAVAAAAAVVAAAAVAAADVDFALCSLAREEEEEEEVVVAVVVVDAER